MLKTRGGLWRACVVLTLGSGAVGVGWLAQASESGRGGKPVARVAERPFVIEFARTDYRQDPKGTPAGRHMLQRRADGALISYSGASGARVLTARFPDGTEIRANENARARTVSGPDRAHAALAATREKRRQLALSRVAEGKTPNCAEMFEFPVGSDVVAGKVVVVFEREALGAEGDIVRMREYRAPDLGCVALRKAFEERTREGAFAKRWEDVAQRVRDPKPSEVDFDTVGSYREVSPAEFGRLSTCASGSDATGLQRNEKTE